MISLDSLLGFSTVSFALAMSPGPSWAYVLSVAASSRRPPSDVAAAILGNAIGIVGHVLAAASGLAVLLSYSVTLFAAIKLLGAGYLCFLGVQLLCRGRAPTLAGSGEVSSTKANLLTTLGQGALVNLLNPKVSLLMLALLPQFVDPAAGSASVQIACLGGVHVVLASVVLTTLAIVASASQRWFPIKPQVTRPLRMATGVLLLFAGIKLAISQR